MASRDRAYSCNLSLDLVERAEQELREKAQWRLRDIQALRDLVLAHPGLNARTDDVFLLKFLRARKFEYDHAYRLLVNYYKARALHADVFQDFQPSSLRPLFDEGVVSVLPNRDQNGARIVVIRPGLYYADAARKQPFYDTFRAALMALEAISGEEETQVNGCVTIVDLSAVSWSALREYLWSGFARVTIGLLQNAFPMRLKAIHFIHGPALLVNSLVLKPFLKDKIVNRIHCHGSDISKLHCQVSRYLLPGNVEIGGTQPPLPHKDFVEWMVRFDSDFREDGRYYLSEEKLVTCANKGATDADPVECFMGSYRKLMSE